MSFTIDPPDLPAFSLHITIYIAEDNVDAFFKEMKPLFDLVAAEPECLYFEIYQDPTDPGKLSWVENWNASPRWMYCVLAGPTEEAILQKILRKDIADVCEGSRGPHPETTRSRLHRVQGEELGVKWFEQDELWPLFRARGMTMATYLLEDHV